MLHFCPIPPVMLKAHKNFNYAIIIANTGGDYDDLIFI